MMSYAEVINILILIIAMIFVMICLFLPKYERKLTMKIWRNIGDRVSMEVKNQLHDFVDKYFIDTTEDEKN